jgi:hypothetical protein
MATTSQRQTRKDRVIPGNSMQPVPGTARLGADNPGWIWSDAATPSFIPMKHQSGSVGFPGMIVGVGLPALLLVDIQTESGGSSFPFVDCTDKMDYGC